MDLSNYKWYGSVDEFDDLIDSLEGKLVIESEWTKVEKENQKLYKCEDFLKAAESYLSQSPPDLIQASEKLWASVVYVVQKFYEKIEVEIKSHRSTRALAHFAIDHADSKKTSRMLALAFADGESLHKNFYRPNLSKAEVRLLQTKVEFFTLNFVRIPHAEVESALQPYIHGKMKNEDLDGTVISEGSKNKLRYCAF